MGVTSKMGKFLSGWNAIATHGMELSHTMATSSKSQVPQPTATSWLGNLSIHPARGRKENHCSRRRNVVSPGLCPRLPVCFIDKPVSKAKETLSWLVGESDQGNCCCPSCNERSGSHRLVARGRSRSTCFYFFCFFYFFYL